MNSHLDLWNGSSFQALINLLKIDSFSFDSIKESSGNEALNWVISLLRAKRFPDSKQHECLIELLCNSPTSEQAIQIYIILNEVLLTLSSIGLVIQELISSINLNWVFCFHIIEQFLDSELEGKHYNYYLAVKHISHYWKRFWGGNPSVIALITKAPEFPAKCKVFLRKLLTKTLDSPNEKISTKNIIYKIINIILYIFMETKIFSDLLFELQSQFSTFPYKQKRDLLEAINSESVMLKISHHLLTAKYIHTNIPSANSFRPKMETRARKKKKRS